MTKGFKFRLKPNSVQKVFLKEAFGARRFIYNYFLAESQEASKLQKENSELPKYPVSSYDFIKRVPLVKLNPEFGWLKEVSSVLLQQSVSDLGTAYQNFFKKRARFPKFKSKKHRQSFRLTNSAFTLKDSQLFIAKCKIPFKVIWSRELPSKPTSITISQETDGNYYVSFVCEYIPEPTNGSEVIGLDMGLKSFYTDSNGVSIEPPKYYIKNLNKLAKLQRQMSRKQKGSNNRNKARLKVARLHAKIKHQREDFLHKLSTTLVNNSKLIAIESINLKGLLKNRRLARAFSDLGWGRFVEFLTYKTIESSWCILAKMDRFYPSTQLCSSCNYQNTKETKLKLNQRHWVCPSCGTNRDRDTNAATNIKQEAIRQLTKVGLESYSGRIVLLEQHCV